MVCSETELVEHTRICSFKFQVETVSWFGAAFQAMV